MALKDLLSRPATSASSNKRFSTVDPRDGTTPRESTTSSPRRGHSRLGSFQRLSLSFMPAKDGESTFQSFLTQEPGTISRENSGEKQDSPSHTVVHDSHTIDALNLDHASKLSPTTEQREDESTETVSPRKLRRLSLLKFRHASEPELSTRYKTTKKTEEALNVEEEPAPPPAIIMTAPTEHHDNLQMVGNNPAKKPERRLLPRAFSSFRRSQVIRDDVALFHHRATVPEPRQKSPFISPSLRGRASEEPGAQERYALGDQFSSPPAYENASQDALALPVTRLSESGGSEGSAGSHQIYAQTTTTRVVETTTTFFKIKRRKMTKDKGPLFPLPERMATAMSPRTSLSNDGGTQERKSISPSRKSASVRWTSNVNNANRASMINLEGFGNDMAGPAITRQQSTMSVHSGTSTPSTSLRPPLLGNRGRSNTMGSLGRSTEKIESGQATPLSRNSTSTFGRRSFGDILTLSNRLRQNSGPPKHSSNQSGSVPGSTKNSIHITREAEPELVYPKREEQDTPASYLEKLEGVVPRGAMAKILCKGSDDFSKVCLRKYMRGFSYFGESIDMSVRKMLMQVVLPVETQQIDRLLASFADRYHECNPGIFINEDEANFVAFSILLLQSDNHNKNNKRKMSKQDYLKNTQNGKLGVADDILECFYDNICYTPFIHFDDEVAVNNHRLLAPKKRTGLIKSRSSENLKGPLDPYLLILDNTLSTLRPSHIKEVIETDDPFSVGDTMGPAFAEDNHKAFVHSAVIQIVSERSRPQAFMEQATIDNPAEASAGLVNIKVAKVGLLWRKAMKKQKTKSPWQEWGAILTDSKLYFFKDVYWTKKLINQYEARTKNTSRTGPLIFSPPLTSFEPQAVTPLDDAVALFDSSYKKHKNAFVFMKPGGSEEVLLANSEADSREWLGKLNYASTFRTANVRMRGLLGENYEGKSLLRRESTRSFPDDDSRKPTPVVNKPDPQMQWEIMFYRRQLVNERISTFDDHVASAQKELDYLLRNARHLLTLLPIQQKTRDAIILAAGRMNAKLKWTRREIWRAKVHRDILLKDLEAEATSAFPVPGPVPSSNLTSTPIRTTPTKTTLPSIANRNTDQNTNASTNTTPAQVKMQSTVRQPSMEILEQIRSDNAESDITYSRRRSVASERTASPLGAYLTPHEGSSIQTPSLHTRPSQFSVANGGQLMDERENFYSTAIAVDETVDARRGSESEKEKDREHRHFSGGHESFKDKAGQARRSLQRSLRESPGMPHHARGKRGKESGSSLAVTENDAGMSPRKESEELKRDPTGHFVLHGKKASVITMDPSWQLEERIRKREVQGKEATIAEDVSGRRASLHLDTLMIEKASDPADGPRAGAENKDDTSPRVSVDVSNDAVAVEEDSSVKPAHRNSSAPGHRFSFNSAVTTPCKQTFHTAHSSPVSENFGERER